MRRCRIGELTLINFGVAVVKNGVPGPPTTLRGARRCGGYVHCNVSGVHAHARFWSNNVR